MFTRLLLRFLLIIISWNTILNGAESANQTFIPIIYDGYVIMVPKPDSGIKTIRESYGEDENVSIVIDMPLSGDQDWAGIYPVNASNDWENVIAWNWVEPGINNLSEILDRMPEGEYEVRLFFHNSFQVEARYRFRVLANSSDIYGKMGNLTVEETAYSADSRVVIYHPSTWDTHPTPVLFFTPGWNSTNHQSYRTLLRFVASHGYSVVYMPDSGSYDSQLEKLHSVSVSYADKFDLTKIGVIGHSSGGGFTFRVLDYLSAKGYGNSGRFLMAFDPWFAFGMNSKKIRNLPANTNLIIQRYEHPDYPNTQDPRITLSEYALLDSLPLEQKDYQVYSPATHGYPGGDKDIDEMQGLLKPFDALMRYTFETVAGAHDTALENGSDRPYEDGLEQIREKWTYSYRCDSHVNRAEVMEIDYCNQYLGGKVYPVSTIFDERTVGNVEKPDYLASYTDPIFGNRVTRITDRAVQSANAKPYPKTQVWNADSTLIRLGYRIYYADNFSETEMTQNALIRGSLTEMKWSTWQPYVLYGIDVREDRFVFVKATINLENNTISYEEMPNATFMKSEYDELKLGKYEGNLDYQDNYVVFAGRKKDTNRVTLIVYHLQNNYGTSYHTIDAQVTTSMKWYVEDENGTFTTDSTQENQMFDWASISALGNYVIVNYRSKKGDEEQEYTIEQYDRRLNHIRRLAEHGNHGDLGVDANGKEVYVEFGFGTLNGEDNRGIWLYPLDGSPRVQLLPDKYNGGHVSCRNFQRPGWCYLNTRYERDGTGMREVFALKLDETRTVQRFAQTHNSTENATYVRVNVSPDGTQLLFNSDWGDVESVIDTYHVKVGE